MRTVQTSSAALGIAVPSPALFRGQLLAVPSPTVWSLLGSLLLAPSDPRGSRHCHSPNPDEPRAAAVTAEQPEEPGG